ncbi:unnamed protein product [Owenia fusiformis]|uniref:Uncharacterized protein n=1 Tax=Owenia fusiformis TaxID=6347 RepID=A0A8J1UVI0_OWEFU|nr:unnamed protein product [Owenia fusiformis]
MKMASEGGNNTIGSDTDHQGSSVDDAVVNGVLIQNTPALKYEETTEHDEPYVSDSAKQNEPFTNDTSEHVEPSTEMTDPLQEDNEGGFTNIKTEVIDPHYEDAAINPGDFETNIAGSGDEGGYMNGEDDGMGSEYTDHTNNYFEHNMYEQTFGQEGQMDYNEEALPESYTQTKPPGRKRKKISSVNKSKKNNKSNKGKKKLPTKKARKSKEYEEDVKPKESLTRRQCKTMMLNKTESLEHLRKSDLLTIIDVLQREVKVLKSTNATIRKNASGKRSLQPRKRGIIPGRKRRTYDDIPHEKVEDGMLKCLKCSKVFYRMFLLARHYDTHRERQYECETCNKKFGSTGLLNSHMKVHKSWGFACHICGKASRIQSHHRDHMMTHFKKVGDMRLNVPGEPESDVMKCAVCYEDLASQDDLQDHYNLHVGIHTSETYSCEVCQQAFMQKARYVEHINKHSGQKPFTCDVCNKLFCRQDSLTRHKLDMHIINPNGEQIFQCDQCPRKYARKKTLRDHMKSHNREPQIMSCEFCDSTFMEKDQLRTHMKDVHPHEKPHKCDKCSQEYALKDSLKRHIERVHHGQSFMCEFCSRTFNERSVLKTHMKIHEDKKIMYCGICYHKFTRDDTLKKHMKVYHPSRESVEPVSTPPPAPIKTEDGDDDNNDFGGPDDFDDDEPTGPVKSFLCDICGFNALQKNSLAKHKRTVHGEDNEEFPCKICDISLWSKQALRKHNSMIHKKDTPIKKTPIKRTPGTKKQGGPFPCSMCSKICSTEGKLSQHFAYKHSDQKPVQNFEGCVCPVCNKTVNTKANLKQHMAFKHEGVKVKTPKNHVCPLCEKPYSIKYMLDQHMRVKHGIVDLDSPNNYQEHATQKEPGEFSGQGEYMCYICNKECGSESKLIQHIAQKHKDHFEFSCDLCKERFSSKNQLIAHRDTAHGISAFPVANSRPQTSEEAENRSNSMPTYIPPMTIQTVPTNAMHSTMPMQMPQHSQLQLNMHHAMPMNLAMPQYSNHGPNHGHEHGQYN